MKARRSAADSFARCLRVHHWSKNLLVFVPLLLSHQFTNGPRLLATTEAAVAFSCFASAGYLINDVLDYEADRKHPEKRHRPIARGDFSVLQAICLCGACIVAGTGVAIAASPVLASLMGAYLVSSIAYSVWLKRFFLIDIFMLVAFYAARILAGGLAADVHLSPWLIQFMLFGFFSLSVGKRVAELHTLLARGETNERRGYSEEDLDLLTLFGAGTGLLSVLIVALYVNSPDVVQMYHHPSRLWLACPLLLYWFTRLWMIIRRGKLKGDPVMFAARDPGTWVVGGIALAIFVAAL